MAPKAWSTPLRDRDRRRLEGLAWAAPLDSRSRGQPTAAYRAGLYSGRVAAPEARTPGQVEAVDLAQKLVDEVKAADVIVLGSGMINFGPSSTTGLVRSYHLAAHDLWL